MTEMTTREALTTARALISDIEHWTISTFARDARGEPVSATDEDACCWCSLGALKRVTDRDGTVDLYWSAHAALQEVIVRVHDFSDIGLFNDHLGHERVIEAFDLAIAGLEG